ncbi:MAG: Na(+)-translocating NADH-quinone reductase subunit A [Haliscomenobacter sp.]|nr:Na(+)-translocating NADH-quinone reductase subunit A [Haliscomenobacter sp.]
MKKSTSPFFLTLSMMLLAQGVFAQGSGSQGSDLLLYGLLAAVVLIFFYLLMQVSDHMLAIEAQRMGLNPDQRKKVGLIPSLTAGIFSKSAPAYVCKAPYIPLKKGFNILLEGVAEKKVAAGDQVRTFGLEPGQFLGMSPIPKVLVEEGANVKAGDLLFYDKKRPEIQYAAPVSGEVIEIRRGEKRAITAIVILADKEIQYRTFDAFDWERSSREDLVTYLLEAGVWPHIRQRPYNIVPNPQDIPRDIFISTFDTAPLAPDLDLVVEGRGEHFQKGLDVLSKLTPGKVVLGLNANGKSSPSPVFTNAQGVEKYWFSGKHPAGNPGVQIHNIRPISTKDQVWVLGVQDVLTMGALFASKKYDAARTVAVAGAELNHPQYVRTYLGASIADLVKDNLKHEHVRAISGDILSGSKLGMSDFLGFYDDQLTIVKEGDDVELFGWLIPQEGRPSVSGTYPNVLFPGRQYQASTNTRGERRAFVMTGQYEDLLPISIYPQHVLKAVITGDYEGMEGLGLKELVEEDVALCEFACTSKQPLQKILREGLDLMHAEE